MRVFVVGTGRCGTTTFYQACRHITNYTVGHESQGFRLPDYIYPDNHIEVSHLNTIALPFLRRKYTSDYFVHLRREKAACVSSWISGHEDLQKELRYWARLWYMSEDLPLAEVASQYYNRKTELCKSFIDNELFIEQAKLWWGVFWLNIHAEGDYDASLKEFSRRYNPGVNRGKDNFIPV